MDRWDMRVFEAFALFWGALFAVASFNGEADPVVPYIATVLLAFGVTTHLLLRERG